jgi:hypothetical protein
MLMGTSERSIRDRLAEFHETTLSVAHRNVPLSVFMWYLASSDQVPELIGQTLFSVVSTPAETAIQILNRNQWFFFSTDRAGMRRASDG